MVYNLRLTDVTVHGLSDVDGVNCVVVRIRAAVSLLDKGCKRRGRVCEESRRELDLESGQTGQDDS